MERVGLLTTRIARACVLLRATRRFENSLEIDLKATADEVEHHSPVLVPEPNLLTE